MRVSGADTGPVEATHVQYASERSTAEMRAWHVISGDWSLPGLDPAVVHLLPVEPLVEMVRGRQPVELALDQVCYREDVVSEDRVGACDITYPCIVAEGVANPGARAYRLLDGNHRMHRMLGERRRTGLFHVLRYEDFGHLVKRFEEYLPDWPVQPNRPDASAADVGGVTELLNRDDAAKGARARDLLDVARRLAGSRRFAGAIELLDEALARDADAENVLRFRARLLRIVSRHDDALEDLARLGEMRPMDPEVWRQRADSLRSLGRIAEAEAAFLESLCLDPALVASMADLGTLYRDAGRHDEALAWLTRAVDQSPADAGLQTLLGAALLAAGRAGEGRQALERAVHINPFDRLAMAYLYVALCRTGDLDAARRLARPDVLLRSFQRPGSSSGDGPADDLDRRLAAHVRTHPTLEYERPDNTTRGGAHSGNLLESSPGPVTGLVQWIEACVRRYLADLPRDRSHPYLAWTPDEWDLDTWGIVIRPGGYQEAHIHQDGWISGVYYVSVPGDVAAGAENDPAGCLEVGRAPDAVAGQASFPTRVLRPRPGRLHLFPSFYWHRTFPYGSDGERICIAFDVRPRV